jgi:hypothetical protein
VIKARNYFRDCERKFPPLAFVRQEEPDGRGRSDEQRELRGGKVVKMFFTLPILRTDSANRCAKVVPALQAETISLVRRDSVEPAFERSEANETNETWRFRRETFASFAPIFSATNSAESRLTISLNFSIFPQRK